MTESNGRDAKGRYTSSNPGRPPGSAGKTTALQNALLDAVSEEDIQEVVTKLVQLAKSGYVPAIKLLLDRACGKPTDDVPDARPFLKLTEHHDERARGFFDHVHDMADGNPVTPQLILEALRRDAAGEFDDALMAIACDEKAEDQA